MRLRALLKKLPLERFRNPPPLVPVVSLAGVIGRVGGLRRGLSIRDLAGTLQRAFEMEDAKAVAIVVDSPGGSPVQSALIARRIRALAAEKKLPVYAFAEDVAASGGYWLLTAGDELWADDCSIIGSIGVVAGSFGFPQALQRLGVERRLYASGEHKAALDPFSPEKPEEVEHLRAMLEDTHESFRAHIRERRAGKLKGDEAKLFSGRFWTGKKALELGLIDGLGDVRTVLRAKFGEKVKLRLVGDGRRWWRRRLGLPGTRRATALDALPEQVLSVLEERLMWSRFGL
ncbi:MAG TPA: S49 family peptidase [Rhodospirillales bacterium]|nr:S49 family peptidase [Rhodospirillales bacterium]